MEVDNSGVNVLQVDDFGLLVTVLMQDGIRTYEKKNSSAHDERTKDLQPIRVQIPVDVDTARDVDVLAGTLNPYRCLQ